MKCVLCGKETESNLCPECYVARNEVVEVSPVSLTECPKCGNFKIAGHWRKTSYDDILQEGLQRNVHVHQDFKVFDVVLTEIEETIGREEKRGGRYKLTLKGEFRGMPFTREKKFSVKITKESCTRCNRESGGYYEAIIQLRATNRKLDGDEIEFVKAVLENENEIEIENPKAFVSKVKELKEGVDYYLGSREMGQKVSRRISGELGAKVKVTKKIAGKAEGRDLFRFTYLVRLPPFRQGDIVVDMDSASHIPILVTNQKLWKGVAFSGETVNLTNRKITRVLKKDEIKIAIVLNSDSSVAEILHPTTNKMVMVKDYWNLEQGENVIFVDYNREYFAFPERLVNL